MQQLRKVGVCGAGMMGAEIGLCFAMSGVGVVMKETSLELAEKGKARLNGVLDKAIKKGTIQAQDKVPILSRIAPTDQYDLFKNVNLVVEAVFEELRVKPEVFS
jgi:3-hydroxyacyl-CoA dehydrogenase